MQRFELTFSTCPVPLLLISADGRICKTNERLDALFAYPPGELIGRSVDILVPSAVRPDHARMREAYCAAPSKRAMGAGRDLHGITRTGRTLPLELGLDPVTVEGQTFILVTAIDISGRRTIEAELARRIDELAALNADLTNFARSVSHDLKSPLASICGLLALCIEDLDGGDIDVARGVALEALAIARRGVQTVETVLSIAHGAESETEPFQLHSTIVDAWTGLVADQTNPPGLELDIDIAEPLVAERRTVSMMLDQLLSNACRFADPAKRDQKVRVRAQRQDGTLHVSVADNGIGIADADRHRVFRAFDRFHPGSGGGIGLTLVRREAERLGGSVSFTSREGEGSEFTLSIPVSARTAT